MQDAHLDGVLGVGGGGEDQGQAHRGGGAGELAEVLELISHELIPLKDVWIS
jgi:hypothetical protein